MEKEILCISTARKNSREVKNKNLVKVKGVQMMYHNIYNALKTKEISAVAVTTDIKIKKIKNKKFHYIARPRNLTHSNSSHKKTMIDCLIKIEKKLNKKAKINYKPLQKGDVYETFADINKLLKVTKYKSKTDINIGIGKFVDWFREYYKC